MYIVGENWLPEIYFKPPPISQCTNRSKVVCRMEVREVINYSPSWMDTARWSWNVEKVQSLETGTIISRKE